MNTEQQETEDNQPVYPNLNISMPDSRKKIEIKKGIVVGRFLYGDLAPLVTALRDHLYLNKVPFETFLLAMCFKAFYCEETPHDIYEDIFGEPVSDDLQDIQLSLDRIAWRFMMELG